MLLMTFGCGGGDSAPRPAATVTPSLTVSYTPTTTASPSPAATSTPSVTAAAAPTITPTSSPSSTPISSPTSTAARPNIIFLLTDDLDAQLNSIEVMPRLKALVIDQGTTFRNAFVTVSLCCPSRTSILRGQYAHNSRIFTNRPPNGGYERVHEQGLESSTVATWLQAAGYRTGLFGKYLNGYPNTVSETFVPPGWDEWASPVGGSPYGELNYRLNENGQVVAYGSDPSAYLTDVLAAKSVAFIQQAGARPFLLYISTYAPHSPATPAQRHQGLFADRSAPRLPSFNELDVSDKPAWVRSRPLLDANAIASLDQLYRRRLRTLLAVDELLDLVVAALQASGQLERTFIVFLSDNGFHLGEHRQTQGKQAPYEEEIRVPLIIRGPGVPRGQTVEQLAGNVDLAPTFAELAGITPPDFVDGRSLCPLLRTSPVPSWRQAFLIEHGPQDTDEEAAQTAATPPIDPGLLEPADEPAAAAAATLPIPPFHGLRTAQYTYVEYTTGERELYDLQADPYQLTNLAATAEPALLAQLAAWLERLNSCAGTECRLAEAAPPAP